MLNGRPKRGPFSRSSTLPPRGPETDVRELGRPTYPQSMRAQVRAVSSWPAPAPAQETVSEALVNALVALGVEHAFGVFGGGIAPFCEALSRSPIRLLHTRHEASAGFAAI